MKVAIGGHRGGTPLVIILVSRRSNEELTIRGVRIEGHVTLARICITLDSGPNEDFN